MRAINDNSVFLPVQADGHEVEDGGSAADDVQGDVEVARHLWETPHPPVYLKHGGSYVAHSFRNL